MRSASFGKIKQELRAARLAGILF